MASLEMPAPVEHLVGEALRVGADVEVLLRSRAPARDLAALVRRRVSVVAALNVVGKVR